jgi:hypothetical protein
MNQDEHRRTWDEKLTNGIIIANFNSAVVAGNS